jgi:hypothetical protein
VCFRRSRARRPGKGEEPVRRAEKVFFERIAGHKLIKTHGQEAQFLKRFEDETGYEVSDSSDASVDVLKPDISVTKSANVIKVHDGLVEVFS